MNLPTIIIALIILAAFVAVVVSSVRNRKKGKCMCGGSCGSCGMNCSKKETE